MAGLVAALVLLTGCQSAPPAGTDDDVQGTRREVPDPVPDAVSPPATPASPPTTPPPVEETEPPPAVPALPADTPGTAQGRVRVIDTVATDIDVPWGLAALPDGTVLVTSRDDHHLYRLAPFTGRRTDLGEIPGVDTDGGEGGLLGVAVSPRFAVDQRIYLYWSTVADNRIGYVELRPKGSAARLSRPTVVLDGIPRGFRHNGGRLAFGPDGMLYAGTGETENTALAQDRDSLGGKVLRMTPEGRAPRSNPFRGSVVYSVGHRNVQGLVFDARGRLFASEFGDHDKDELNWIRPGRNYGWPYGEGITDLAGFESPVAEFGTEEDSPSGVAIAGGSVFMGALAGQRLWRIPLDGTRLVAPPTSFLQARYGRLRSVLALDERTLLVTTSNQDGRITPYAGDDKILMLRVS